jgi:hypothetical protein
VVHLTLTQEAERAHARKGKVPGEGLCLVIEINEDGLVEARLDESVGVAV